MHCESAYGAVVVEIGPPERANLAEPHAHGEGNLHREAQGLGLHLHGEAQHPVRLSRERALIGVFTRLGGLKKSQELELHDEGDARSLRLPLRFGDEGVVSPDHHFDYQSDHQMTTKPKMETSKLEILEKREIRKTTGQTHICCVVDRLDLQ